MLGPVQVPKHHKQHAPGRKLTAEKGLLGIGSCLTGQSVRYDGSSKPANQFVQNLAREFQMVSFCPEMGIGMAAPRPPIQIVGGEGEVRALDVASHTEDYTVALQDYAIKALAQQADICGYILVKASPSCGYSEVKRFSKTGKYIASDTQGVYAAKLAELDPLLPLADDDSLCIPALRESFAARARAYHQWKRLHRKELTVRGLRDFCGQYKSLMLARRPADWRRMSAILADAQKRPLDSIATDLISTLMHAL